MLGVRRGVRLLGVCYIFLFFACSLNSSPPPFFWIPVLDTAISSSLLIYNTKLTNPTKVLPQIPKLPSPTQLGASLALVALFGYDSIETHMKWRETPEHAKAIEVMGRMSKEIGLKDFEVGGGGMWHVDFHSYP